MTRVQSLSAVIVALAAVVSSWFAYQGIRDDPPPRPRMSATFESPTEGDHLSFITRLPKGTVTGLGSRSLWLFHRKSDEIGIRPLPIPCEVMRGNWECTDLYLGRSAKQDRGEIYELVLLAVDAAADERFRLKGRRPRNDRARYTVLAEPIPGSTRIASIRVIRK